MEGRRVVIDNGAAERVWLKFVSNDKTSLRNCILKATAKNRFLFLYTKVLGRPPFFSPSLDISFNLLKTRLVPLSSVLVPYKSVNDSSRLGLVSASCKRSSLCYRLLNEINLRKMNEWFKAAAPSLSSQAGRGFRGRWIAQVTALISWHISNMIQIYSSEKTDAEWKHVFEALLPSGPRSFSALASLNGLPIVFFLRS